MLFVPVSIVVSIVVSVFVSIFVSVPAAVFVFIFDTVSVPVAVSVSFFGRVSIAMRRISSWSKANAGISSKVNHFAFDASSPAFIALSSVDAVKAIEIVRPRGSLLGSLKQCNCLISFTSSPVSSLSSLLAPSSAVSFMFKNPPGSAHMPLNGSPPRSMSKTFISSLS